jgi:hypothetical protein
MRESARWNLALTKALYGQAEHSTQSPGRSVAVEVLSESAIEAGMEASLQGRPSVDDSAYVLSIYKAMRNANREGGAVICELDVDSLAQIIRKVDGSHSLGAGELAEKIFEELAGGGYGH